ncbi:MAG: MSEP-CTERM sorting domain-containing protein [Elusimicrobia bacterium]|nr:MSEP-CTERM sorting domain-containing protein [Elusimicrobiota bacterium]
MRNSLNPKWLFIINAIPIGILFAIFLGEYNIIKSLLSAESIGLWKKFGGTLAILGTLNFIYAVDLVIKKKEVSAFYSITALLSYISFLYLYGNYFDVIIPFDIPQWMVPTNMILYVGTFLMPTLAYSLFTLVALLTPENKEQKVWKNFLIALIIPISWYLFTQLIFPLWKPVDSNFSMHAMVILAIIATLIFLFFLIRGIYILGLKKAAMWVKYQLAWKIPIALIFPLLGLALNNKEYFFNKFGVENSGTFGDFSNIWFYILAVINGLLICLPNSQNKLYRLFLFAGRSLTFAFTFYFFLVFLPFLPFSIIAIAAVGTGFLMLTPLALFIIHLNELLNDYKFPQTYLSKKLAVFLSVAGFFVLPLFITATYLMDRRALNETLEYLYKPDYSKTYNIDKISLSKTLDVVKYHKDRNLNLLFEKQIPYLSSYFNWLVLDNLTLSDSKINTIENVFYGKTSFKLRAENIGNTQVKISKINSSSTFDEKQNAWTSWMDLEITNHSETTQLSEYATTIELPIGCWISDYYLYVGNKKEMGILAEKKSAIWVFSQIRNENRDPGILHYLSGNKVVFRVFPFSKGETRKTGIEFIHQEPVKITIDGTTLRLGNYKEHSEIRTTTSSNENIVYVSAKEKTTLKKIQRKPYYHFIVDISSGKENFKEDFAQRIKSLLSKNLIGKENAKISFANTYTRSLPLDNNWRQKFDQQIFDGGFFLDRAIRTVLFNSYKDRNNAYPVIVVVTDSIENAIIEKDFSDFKIAYPENNLFYVINQKWGLESHSLLSNPKIPLTGTLELNFNHKVLAYPNKQKPIAYLPNHNKPSIVLKETLFEVNNSEIIEKSWQTGLIMQGKWISQTFHPETSGKEWLNLVKHSFISKIMTPITSYIVVENEAQKAILKQKQDKLLLSNQSLDLGEDTQRMTEPSLILLITLLGLILIICKSFYKSSARFLLRSN